MKKRFMLELIKTLQRLLLVAVIIFFATFFQIYWAMGTLSSKVSSGCVDCSFFFDACILSLLTSFFIPLLFQVFFFMKNKFIKIPIEFLVLASVWMFWDYTIFVERESSWSTYLFNEEINHTILLSLFPVVMLAFVSLFILNFKVSWANL